jgi:shikimate dehydrogenase
MSKLFVSLSQYPGTTGKRYYTNFFQKYKLDYQYDPRGTDNLEKSIYEALEQGANGISISMPFKKEVIQYLDVLDSSVKDYNTCNTILVQQGQLIGYNTDFYGALHVQNYLTLLDTISILGNGAMANMFQLLLSEYKVTSYARNLDNWDQRLTNADVIINCTSFGTSSTNSPFDILPSTRIVIDLSINSFNQLSKQCNQGGTKYVPGIEFYKHQFIRQFKIYTGIELNDIDLGTI